MTPSKDLIKEFFKQQETNLSFEQIKEICDAPFEMMKETMADGSLEEVRLQYLFTIRPSIQKIIKYLRIAYEGYAKGTMPKKTFKKYDLMLCKYMYNHQNKFTKYETTVEQITGATIEENGRRVLSELQED